MIHCRLQDMLCFTSKLFARRSPLAGLLFAVIFVNGRSADITAADAPRPNIIVIFADDLGYGDLGCYGHPTIRTPRLDQLAAQGMRFTQFYSAAEVCSPSRAGILTGRHPLRSGMCGKRRVLFPDSKGGIQDSELTLAEMLRTAGYSTMCIGKWHLGHLPQYLPTRHGFDHYFGIPYSNDMGPGPPRPNRVNIFPPLPLIRDEQTIETEPDQPHLTERYTDEALNFIRTCHAADAAKPFFLYLPHTMPHVPLFTAAPFEGQSPRGLYGDVVETIDWSTGRIVDLLNELHLADQTLIVFTSDNGPWITLKTRGGSAGPLKEGKGSTWEGGYRVPGIFWWPDHVPSGVVTTELASALDLFATCAALAGATVPADVELDGCDQSPLLLGSGRGARDHVLYFRECELFAIRQGPWKLHFKTQAGYVQPKPDVHDPPLLFHLGEDPGERFDVAGEHPDIVSALKAEAQKRLATIKPGPPQI